ncbi:MAG: sulfite exporter TauE/SafE family protein [Alphaproteobacteria bacterium]
MMDWTLAEYAILGFCAQMVDGALGMAYGVISTTFLLSMGLPPATASASVHAAEVVTTGVSGVSHAVLGNVDRRLFLPLAVSGMLGGILGAYVLTEIPGDLIKPFVAVYLLVVGIIILRRGIFGRQPRKAARRIWPLGLGGGFLDAAGGGGWGPVVTTTLLARGHMPRRAIGSVSLSEFFVSAATATTFITTIGIDHWRIVAGLIAGGALAAPLAALAVKRIKPRMLMIAVGALVIGLSVRTLVLSMNLLA